MAEIWLTSDWHLGEDRFDIMDRPFATVDQAVNQLVSNHNALVGKGDTVYVVGDVCYQKTPEFLDRVALFNGKKILIRGNHDRMIDDTKFKKFFEQVIPEGMGVDLISDGVKCYATHYPTRGKEDRFNLVGHIHAVWKFQLNMMNIGVDVNHFRPVNLGKIPAHFKAVNEFYDEDAWAAYDPINFVYKNKRGKKGSYLPK
jgi:calcineurin-like phosphoesterase family protein